MRYNIYIGHEFLLMPQVFISFYYNFALTSVTMLHCEIEYNNCTYIEYDNWVSPN